MIRVSVSLLLVCSATAWGLAPGDLPHRVHVEGQGSVTVVLESGLGDTLDVWKDVQPQIASGCARTVSYNRSGYLGSDPSDSPRDAAVIVAERGLVQLSDSSEIDALIDQVLAANQQQVASYREGKETLFGFFVGQVMKASKGKANPKIVNERLQEKLKS